MKKFCYIAFLLLGAVTFIGCAAYGPGIIPVGVIRTTDPSGKGFIDAYHVYTAYGQDKNGINTATTLVVDVTPSLPGQPAKSRLVYGQSAAQTGIDKALVEQIIPAMATVAEGTVPGILIANAYRDAASTYAKSNIEAAKILDPAGDPAGDPNTTINYNISGQTQIQGQSQSQLQSSAIQQGYKSFLGSGSLQ